MSLGVFGALLPPGLAEWAAVGLVGVSFVTSMLTAAFGIGGGVLLLATMAPLVPPAAIIPVHGVVQLGSNVGRAVLQRAHIDWPTFGYFLIGGAVGAALGGQVAINLPGDWLRGGLGLFILYSVWGPKPRVRRGDRLVNVLMGAFASFLTMFFGATGPFVAASLAARLDDRLTYVGTHAACMTAQHGLKVLVFGLLGFAFAPWLPLVVAMIVTGFAGTFVGTRLLHRLPEARFRTGLKLLLTVLALNLLAGGLGLW